MFKKYFFKILPVIIIACILYGTNPDYEKHEIKVAMMCRLKSNSENTLLCPLGYGKKDISTFKQNLFFVYNAGVFSYSIYENRLTSIGFFGNVFLRPDINAT
tara:strand:- start:85 stop:390 length:306 start_codon:yes stop_codon:yes gene_type:complete